MANQQWESLLNGGNPASSGAGTALTTATTATLSPQGSGSADYAVLNPPGQPYGWYPGLLLHVVANGFLTTTTTSTTATVFLAANKSNGGSTFVTLATPSGITTGTTAITGIQWRLEAWARCTGNASSGNTVSTQGWLTLGNSGAGTPANPIALTASAGMTLPMPNASGENAAAVDTTVLQALCVRGTLAGANATLQLTQWFAEALC